MPYKEALKNLNTLIRYDVGGDFRYGRRDFDLERFRRFLKVARIPYSKLKVIQVAGSKGKGSTARVITELLKVHGKKTGLFISPFIEDVRESISVNGKWITQKDFTVFMERFTDLIVRSKITYFEALTAMGFWYFEREKVDFATLEVGLGGRLDTTSVANPVASVITPIEKEHMMVLGTTLREIALEKIAIIRPGRPVFCAGQKSLVKKLVESACYRKKATLFYEPERTQWKVKKMTGKGMILSVWTEKQAYLDLQSRLLGKHQAANISLALAVVEKLVRRPELKKVKKTLEGIRWAGRFEVKKIKGKK